MTFTPAADEATASSGTLPLSSGAVVFALSSLARFVTGQLLAVDGGFVMHRLDLKVDRSGGADDRALSPIVRNNGRKYRRAVLRQRKAMLAG